MSGGHSALACTVSIVPDAFLIILVHNVPGVVSRNEVLNDNVKTRDNTRMFKVTISHQNLLAGR